ncbi:DUF2508 family protein [Schleiferilactobacillus harbinensis]|jgi:hypothetical protein|uniref:DUF2508 family protein n=2 Tax=Schleiferilactobacillus harbinensis TaxID=304207 RepID=A0A510TW19_9LACO|nr:YaaL family protein [Schleiferilactobacillus harbinensis]KRM27257.1 hypothetical protein FC91_GL002694 [Schleiferilactobacillus harbinensis DSM 16991]MBO3091556.1 YaaL family protein [Schleiferilactobacillus harbinensis]MCI1687878.1 YaaL family protein [Schleiferilactobacillus harbinensis]MCI1782387.1 YaaL family protein [Schleiferilactobacillus harbinensis]MCI1852051.1 YaaL family protein [Schleiferilactobacillus harbinensis]
MFKQHKLRAEFDAALLAEINVIREEWQREQHIANAAVPTAWSDESDVQILKARYELLYSEARRRHLHSHTIAPGLISHFTDTFN